MIPLLLDDLGSAIYRAFHTVNHAGEYLFSRNCYRTGECAFSDCPTRLRHQAEDRAAARQQQEAQRLFPRLNMVRGNGFTERFPAV